MSDASATPSSTSASTETLVGRLLHPSTDTTELLHSYQLDRLSSPEVLAIFQLAIERGSVDFLHKLLASRLLFHENELTRRVLRCIVEEGDATLLEALLASPHVTFSDETAAFDETTPLLHIAARQDNVDLVAVLLRNLRLDINAHDGDHGWTALHCAVEWDSVAVQTLLLQAGADINARASDGMTPVHCAVQWGYFDSVRFLVDSGADISLTDHTGATPLHTAAREGHTALVEYLLHRGAKLNALDAEGRTPLHVAAFYDESAARFARGENDTQVAVVRALLAHGADVHARDAHGNTVLHSAQLWRFDVIVDELLAHQGSSKTPAAA